MTTPARLTRRPGERLLRVALVAAMVTPPLVALVALVGRRWLPVDDFALIDLRTRDVWSLHPPLTGLASRPGWNHPGPAQFWLAAPLSAITGGAAWATRVGGALAEAVALAWLAIVTARAGTRLLAMAAAVTGLTYLAVGDWVIRQPWNLHFPLIGLILVIFLAVLVATGSFRQLIALVAVASVVVQFHVGFAVPAGTAIAVALGATALDARRERRMPSRWRSTGAWTLAALLVLWLPALLDVALHWPGNLGRIASYFARGEHTTVGADLAAGVFAAEFRWVPPWLGGARLQDPFVGFAIPASRTWLLVPLVLLAAAIVASLRSRDRLDRRATAVAVALTVVAVPAIASADEPRAYTFEWRVVVASFLVVTALAAVGTLAARASPRMRPLLAVGAACVALWGATDLAVRVLRPSPALLEARAGALQAAMPAIRAEADRSVPQRVLVRQVGGTLRGLFAGVVNELDREGVDVRVDPPLGRVFGDQRRGSEAGADVVWYVTELGSRVPELLGEQGATLLVDTSPLSRAENDELDRLQGELASQLVRAGRRDLLRSLDRPLVAILAADVPGVDRTLADRVAALNQRVARHDGCRCAVVAVPGGRDRPSPA